MNTTDSKINKLFNNLDAWRHLPAYQLERRADIFFSLYLAEVLKEHKNLDLEGELSVIPEFPIRYGTVSEAPNVKEIFPELFGNSGENQSFKIDYLVARVDGKSACFVELKTDNSSISSNQILYTNAARVPELGTLVTGLATILTASNAKGKYRTLLKHTEHMKDWNVKPTNVFILPRQPTEVKLRELHEATIITFDQFAEVVEKHPDYLSLRFAKSLREWAKDEAGSPK